MDILPNCSFTLEQDEWLWLSLSAPSCPLGRARSATMSNIVASQMTMMELPQTQIGELVLANASMAPPLRRANSEKNMSSSPQQIFTIPSEDERNGLPLSPENVGINTFSIAVPLPVEQDSRSCVKIISGKDDNIDHSDQTDERKAYIAPLTPSSVRRNGFSTGSTPSFSPTSPTFGMTMSSSTSPSSTPTSPVTFDYAQQCSLSVSSSYDLHPSPRTTISPLSPTLDPSLHTESRISHSFYSQRTDYFSALGKATKDKHHIKTTYTAEQVKQALCPIVTPYLMQSLPTVARAPAGTQARDEQNRQKSKRYYDRKKAQLAAMAAIYTALGNIDTVSTLGLPTFSDADGGSSLLALSSTSRREDGKLSQRAEELIQMNCIAAAAEQLRLALLHAPAHTPTLTAILQDDGFSAAAASVLRVWLGVLPSWSDLYTAEKRLLTASSTRPILGLFRQLWLMV